MLSEPIVQLRDARESSQPSGRIRTDALFLLLFFDSGRLECWCSLVLMKDPGMCKRLKATPGQVCVRGLFLSSEFAVIAFVIPTGERLWFVVVKCVMGYLPHLFRCEAPARLVAGPQDGRSVDRHVPRLVLRPAAVGSVDSTLLVSFPPGHKD